MCYDNINTALDSAFCIAIFNWVFLQVKQPKGYTEVRTKFIYLLGFYAAFNNISVISRRQFTYSWSLGKQTSTRLENVPCQRALHHDRSAATPGFEIPDANHSTTEDKGILSQSCHLIHMYGNWQSDWNQFNAGFRPFFNIISIISWRQFIYSWPLCKQTSTKLGNVPCPRAFHHHDRCAATGGLNPGRPVPNPRR